jgi:hypothetical protein|tara:strand:+ start:1107 stop:1340 length:234 start_codon:yes stop_codon:yes gene_type:complete
MASSKNKLTEDQLVEGILTKILQSIFSRRTQQVMKGMKNNPALEKATEDFFDAGKKLDRSLRKAAKLRAAHAKKFRS